MLWHSYSDDTCFGTSLPESSDIFFDLLEPLDDGDIIKPKKCVTFSDKMATYLFRPNSSILGRREKNQKKAKKKKERALKKLNSLENSSSQDDDPCAFFGKKINDEIEIVKAAIAMQRCGISTLEDNSYSSSTDVDTSSSGCDTSASDCSADETNTIEEEHLNNNYENECKTTAGETKNTKSKRKNRRRRRNRENKMTMKTFLETGGYDSE